jgi:hypothetical protein
MSDMGLTAWESQLGGGGIGSIMVKKEGVRRALRGRR